MAPRQLTRSTLRGAGLAFAGLSLWACGVLPPAQRPAPLDSKVRWALCPVRNLVEAPQAGERIEAMLGTLLRQRGIEGLESCTHVGAPGELPEIDEERRYQRALEEARRRGYVYAIGGHITEWQYKSGFDSAPAVGLSLEVIEVGSGRVVFSAAGSLTGWSSSSLSGTAQNLLELLLDRMELK